MKAALVLFLALTGAARAAEPPAAPDTPAARGAQAAQNSGEMGSEKPVIPQVSIPLKRKASPTTAIVPAPGADVGVDDRIARCRAKEDPQQRMACEGELAQGRPRPAPRPKASMPAR